MKIFITTILKLSLALSFISQSAYALPSFRRGTTNPDFMAYTTGAGAGASSDNNNNVPSKLLGRTYRLQSNSNLARSDSDVDGRAISTTGWGYMRSNTRANNYERDSLETNDNKNNNDRSKRFKYRLLRGMKTSMSTPNPSPSPNHNSKAREGYGSGSGSASRLREGKSNGVQGITRSVVQKFQLERPLVHEARARSGPFGQNELLSHSGPGPVRVPADGSRASAPAPQHQHQPSTRPNPSSETTGATGSAGPATKAPAKKPKGEAPGGNGRRERERDSGKHGGRQGWGA